MLKAAALLAPITLGIIVYLSTSNNDPTVPNLPDTYWGPSKVKKESTDIRPFTIDVPASVIEDLKHRLATRRSYVQPLENVGWTYGISTEFLNSVLDHWKDKYNWTERQALLNKYPQFKTVIQGLDIHFYHVRPTNLPKNRNLKVLPLLLLHGWPGSIVEFQKIIPILTTPSPDRDFVFEVIAPSLPGYGFSEGAVRPGMSTAQMSVVFKNLMQRLKFEKFYVQGGDWGALVAANMGVLFPEKVIGLHSNMCSAMGPKVLFWSIVGTYFPSLVGVDSEHYSMYFPVSAHLSNLIEESGYFHIQATKPDTIGAALASAPDGLAAYILEKFSTWTNKAYRQRDDGGIKDRFNINEILDNIMVYWVTNSITTSARLYAENFSAASRATKIDQLPVKVPTACAAFPNELLLTAKSILSSRYPNIIQYNLMERGGHFAAFEEPQLLANDIFSFVEKTEKIRALPQKEL
ncbi:juvenile hormone epoxide hydrolase 1 [Megalopta genalis]|uniref:juvenile hormone epoxide hydrolase 1 n=1 Tax=Megalopta genalis TaxID=115081 RepID=UPI0014434971|nr:juvenile hormone epoxide hydrolase 1-like [Megalopta genalis]